MWEIISNFDIYLLTFFMDNLRSEVLDNVMPFISALGNFGIIWIVIALFLIRQKQYRTVGITVLTALLLCGLIGNLGLKPLIARLRPEGIPPEIALLIPQPTDYSFPSGHTMSSFASAAVMLWHNKRAGCYTLLAATLMAYSRLYLCLHYPTDILGGIVLGSLIGMMAVLLVRAVHRRYNSARHEHE